MTTPINRKRLWLIMTILWIAIILFCFGFRALAEFDNAGHSYDQREGDQVRADWSVCLQRFGLNESSVWSEFGKECVDEAEKLCGKAMFPRECVDLMTRDCPEGKEPHCRYVFLDHQKEWGKSYQQRPFRHAAYFLTSSYSHLFWVELMLLLVGPLALWLGPKVGRRLVRWLHG